MQRIAKITRGVYSDVDFSTSIDELALQAQNQLTRQAAEYRMHLEPKERYQWPLLAGMGLLVAGLLVRRYRPTAFSPGPVIAALVVLGGLGMPSAQAQTAVEYFEQGEYRKSLEAYQDILRRKPGHRDRNRICFGIGAAAYRDGDFDLAVDYFGQALLDENPTLQQAAHYNLGNALFRRGEARATETAPKFERVLAEWSNARRHYEAALALNPDHVDTLINLRIVEARIREWEARKRMASSGEKTFSSPESDDRPVADGKQGKTDEDKNGEYSSDEARRILAEFSSREPKFKISGTKTKQEGEKFW
ncbi:MAG: tetratricopeptide repeat protein [Verrucomicrobiota bacterium]